MDFIQSNFYKQGTKQKSSKVEACIEFEVTLSSMTTIPGNNEKRIILPETYVIQLNELTPEVASNHYKLKMSMTTATSTCTALALDYLGWS